MKHFKFVSWQSGGSAPGSPAEASPLDPTGAAPRIPAPPSTLSPAPLTTRMPASVTRFKKKYTPHVFRRASRHSFWKIEYDTRLSATYEPVLVAFLSH